VEVKVGKVVYFPMMGKLIVAIRSNRE
jgi:hypothetical protein